MMIIAVALIAVGVASGIWGDRNASAAREGYVYSPGRGDSLNVAIAYSPLSLYRYGDTLGGLNYEICRSMAAMYGEKVRYWPVTSVSESLDRLEKGVYDIVIADIPVTATLRERFRFSVPVYTDHMVLVSRDTTQLSSLDLAGTQVWAVASSPAAERLANLSREIGDSIDIRDTHLYTAEQLVMLVAAGEIPRAVVNEEVARSLMAEYPDIHISTDVSLSQFQSWIMNRDSVALADTIDARIERFKTTEAYRELLSKWTGD